MDATGAGDAFIGGLLAEIAHLGLSVRGDLSDSHIHALLDHAAKVGAITTLQRGAINSMPDRARLQDFPAGKPE